jgi:peptidyl-prolyl isomerase F (cyclophilin D)
VLYYKETPWLDGKNVVVGQIIRGFSVAQAIRSVRSSNGMARPPVEVKIMDCGQLLSACNKTKES